MLTPYTDEELADLGPATLAKLRESGEITGEQAAKASGEPSYAAADNNPPAPIFPPNGGPTALPDTAPAPLPGTFDPTPPAWKQEPTPAPPGAYDTPGAAAAAVPHGTPPPAVSGPSFNAPGAAPAAKPAGITLSPFTTPPTGPATLPNYPAGPEEAAAAAKKAALDRNSQAVAAGQQQYSDLAKARAEEKVKDDADNAAARAKTQQVAAEWQTRANAQLKDIQDDKVDPDHWWHSRDAFQKGSAILGLALGGFLQGFKGGPNPAMDMINKAIDDDIGAQKENFERKKTGFDIQSNLYAQNMAQLKDDQSALLATQIQHLNQFKQQSDDIAQSTQSAQAMSNNDRLKADIDQQLAAKEAQLGERMNIVHLAQVKAPQVPTLPANATASEKELGPGGGKHLTPDEERNVAKFGYDPFYRPSSEGGGGLQPPAAPVAGQPGKPAALPTAKSAGLQVVGAPTKKAPENLVQFDEQGGVKLYAQAENAQEYAQWEKGNGKLDNHGVWAKQPDGTWVKINRTASGAIPEGAFPAPAEKQGQGPRFTAVEDIQDEQDDYQRLQRLEAGWKQGRLGAREKAEYDGIRASQPKWGLPEMDISDHDWLEHNAGALDAAKNIAQVRAASHAELLKTYGKFSASSDQGK